MRARRRGSGAGPRLLARRQTTAAPVYVTTGDRDQRDGQESHDLLVGNADRTGQLLSPLHVSVSAAMRARRTVPTRRSPRRGRCRRSWIGADRA